MFSIGCDPEFFVAKRGVPVPACGLVPGTKDEPFKTEVGAMQVDGLALEININPVPLMSSHINEFDRRIIATLRTTRDAAIKNGGQLSVYKGSVAEFSEETMDGLSDDDKRLGCDPDWNAYTCQPNETPDGSVNFRAAGGHIHIGWDDTASNPVDDPDYIAMCADFVKVMDLFVGIPMKILDTEERRRQMYGKAGAFRPKPYGVEYRSPSNWWIFEKSRRLAVFEMTKAAVDAMTRYGDAEKVLKAYTYAGFTPDRVQSIIDNPDGRADAISLYNNSLNGWSFPCDNLIRNAIAKG